MSPTSSLSPEEIHSLVAPMLLAPLPDTAYQRLALYLQLLYRWNERMNLTAIRDPLTLARLHVAECLRCAQRIPNGVDSMLDFGSGAGLPGIPIQIARPELAVTLAESQNKKAGFLREAARVLEFSRTRIFAGRVENMAAAEVFDVVSLRAVDRMQDALKIAESRLAPGGWCMVLTSAPEKESVIAAIPSLTWDAEAIPGTEHRILQFGMKNV